MTGSTLNDQTSNLGIGEAQFAQPFLNTKAVEAAADMARTRVMTEIDRLNLNLHVAQLERDGFTILAPPEAGPREFVNELHAAVISFAKRKMGNPANFDSGETHRDLVSPFGSAQHERSILLAGEVFERALMHEKSLALVSYLLGDSCILSHMTAVAKGPGSEYLPLHADQNQTSSPAPFPAYAQVANVTWALSDYTSENGAICFVPGSHKFCRHPNASEATDLTLFKPVEAPAGSVIIWHGNTWHSAVPRTAQGLRTSLILYFVRWYLTPIEDLSDQFPAEVLARNSDRFRVLTMVDRPANLLESKDAAAAIRARAMRIGLFA